MRALHHGLNLVGRQGSVELIVKVYFAGLLHLFIWFQLEGCLRALVLNSGGLSGFLRFVVLLALSRWHFLFNLKINQF